MFSSCTHRVYDDNISLVYKDVGVDYAEEQILSEAEKVEKMEQLFGKLRKNTGLAEDSESCRQAALYFVNEYISPCDEKGEHNATFDLLETELNKRGKSLSDINYLKTFFVGFLLGMGR